MFQHLLRVAVVHVDNKIKRIYSNKSKSESV